MNDKSERYLYQIARTKWVFGPKGNTKIIRHMKGLSDFVVGFRHPNQCVLSTLMGVASDTYIPAFSGEKCLDTRYKFETQSMEMSLIESANNAEEDGLYDEAREYREELADIQKHLKGDFISARTVKRLYDGEIKSAFTHVVRQRKRRALKRLHDEGFVEEATDLRDSFDVQDRSIVYLIDQCNYEWILSPDKDIQSRAPLVRLNE